MLHSAPVPWGNVLSISVQPLASAESLLYRQSNCLSRPMVTLLLSAILSTRWWFRSPAALQVEILALRHQLTVLKRSQRGRLRLNSADRLLWVKRFNEVDCLVASCLLRIAEG